jgi:hypothetical protein
MEAFLILVDIYDVYFDTLIRYIHVHLTYEAWAARSELEAMNRVKLN